MGGMVTPVGSLSSDFSIFEGGFSYNIHIFALVYVNSFAAAKDFLAEQAKIMKE